MEKVAYQERYEILQWKWLYCLCSFSLHKHSKHIQKWLIAETKWTNLDSKLDLI